MTQPEETATKSTNLAHIHELERRLHLTEETLHARTEEFKMYFKLYVQMKKQYDELWATITAAPLYDNLRDSLNDDINKWSSAISQTEEEETAFKKYMDNVVDEYTGDLSD